MTITNTTFKYAKKLGRTAANQLNGQVASEDPEFCKLTKGYSLTDIEAASNGYNEGYDYQFARLMLANVQLDNK